MLKITEIKSAKSPAYLSMFRNFSRTVKRHCGDFYQFQKCSVSLFSCGVKSGVGRTTIGGADRILDVRPWYAPDCVNLTPYKFWKPDWHRMMNTWTDNNSRLMETFRFWGSVHTWCPGTVPRYDSKLSTNVNTPVSKYPTPNFRLGAHARVQGRDLVLGHQAEHWVLVWTRFVLVP